MKKSKFFKLSLVASVAVVLVSGAAISQNAGLPKSMQPGYKPVTETISSEEARRYVPTPSYNMESDTATHLPIYSNVKYNPGAAAPTMPVGSLEVDKSNEPNTSSERTYFLDENGKPVYGQEIPINLIRKKKVNDFSPRSEAPKLLREEVITEQKTVSANGREIEVLSGSKKIWTPVTSGRSIEETNIPKLANPDSEGVTILSPEELEKTPESKTETKKKSESSSLQIERIKHHFQKLADNNYQNPLDDIRSFEVASNDESFVIAQVYNSYDEDPLVKAAKAAGAANALVRSPQTKTTQVKRPIIQDESNIPTFLRRPVASNKIQPLNNGQNQNQVQSRSVQSNQVQLPSEVQPFRATNQWRATSPVTNNSVNNNASVSVKPVSVRTESQQPILEEDMKTLPQANVDAISQPENLSDARGLIPPVKRPANKEVPAQPKQVARPVELTPVPNFAPVAVAPSAVTRAPAPTQTGFMNTGYNGSGYNMEQFLAQAYSKNPQLTSLREAIKAADEGMPQALSGFLPRLDINLNNSITKSGSGSGNDEDFYPDSQSLEVNQSIFGGGETYYQVKAAEDRIVSARYELKSEEQNFLREAVEAYVNLIFSRKVFSLSQKNESSLTDNLESTRQRFAIGDTTRTDVAQSESRLANAVSNRVSSENDFINSKSVFRRIFLSDAPDNITMPVNLPPLPKNLDEALTTAIRNNPDIQKDLYAKNQRDNEIEVQRSQLYPQVDLTGSVSQRESVSGTSLFNNDQQALGLNVRVPIYDSGITYSRTREAKGRRNQSEFEYQTTILRTRDRVIQAWQALASASLNIEATKAALLAAQYALDGVKEEQREGQRAIFEILDAQREMFSAEVSHARAIRDSVLAMYNLKAAVGQLSPSDLGLPVKDYDPVEHYNNTKFKFIGF